ncbi:MAG: patatin-like phospholipase family protein [Candidatus Bipolaricaulota bacterium]|nr:patatin-like phospholipase family protein [Candidatus Bipolaricaulota bacterium]
MVPERAKVGLALGGGGARGFAHLGVLIAFEENGIPVDLITGTSMGAATGAAKALGMDLKKLARLLDSLDLNDLFHVSGSTIREIQRAVGRGMVEYMRGTSWRQEETAPEKLARMYEFFSLITAKKSFSDTVIPFAVVAADLETGERIVLNEGKIYQAVTASAAVPGVFYPVRHRGRFLVDGGLVDKVPADVAIDMGASAVIAVDTGAPLSRRVDTSLDALLQSERITSQHLLALQLDQARERLGGRLVLLRPDVHWINMFGFEHISEAIAAGKKEALARLGEIADACGLPSPSAGSTQRTVD